MLRCWKYIDEGPMASTSLISGKHNPADALSKKTAQETIIRFIF